MAATRRTSQRVTLLMLLLASLTVLTLDYHGEASRAIGHVRHGVSGVLAPIQRGISAVLHPIGDVVSGSIHYGSLETQNEKLRSEIGALRQQVTADNLASASGKQLLQLSGLSFVGSIPTVDAEVLSGATSNFEASVEIDRGTSSGVGVGMPVVADAGLIGLVTSASGSTATVEVIDDHRSTISVRDAAGDLFTATGNGAGGALDLTLLSGSGKASKGDLLETSAQVKYPAGLPVATVSGLHTTVEGSPVASSASAVVNLSDLDYVAVLQWLPSP